MHARWSAPRSDPKKLEKLEKVETISQGRSALSQGVIFLKVAPCIQGIFIFVSRSDSVWVFSRCLQQSTDTGQNVPLDHKVSQGVKTLLETRVTP